MTDIEVWGGARDGGMIPLESPWPREIVLPADVNLGAISMEQIMIETSVVPADLEVDLYRRARFHVSNNGQLIPREKMALAAHLERFVKWRTTDAREPPHALA